MPKMECCISPSSTPERSTASLIAAPPNSGALKAASAPPNLPNGVRAAPRIIARSTSLSLRSRNRRHQCNRKEPSEATSLVRYGARKAIFLGESKTRRSRGEHRRLRDDLRAVRVGDAREVQLRPRRDRCSTRGASSHDLAGDERRGAPPDLRGLLPPLEQVRKRGQRDGHRAR